MIKLELTTPERVVFREEADQVTLPTVEGEITILPGHVPLVAVVSSGMMTIHRAGKEEYVAITGGFVEVQPGSRVVILADTADRAAELDLQKVEEARERAHKLLEQQRDADDVTSAAMMASLNREMARLKVLHKYRIKTTGEATPPETAG